jgi:hypothetical protein
MQQSSPKESQQSADLSTCTDEFPRNVIVVCSKKHQNRNPEGNQFIFTLVLIIWSCTDLLPHRMVITHMAYQHTGQTMVQTKSKCVSDFTVQNVLNKCKILLVFDSVDTLST